LTWSHIEHLIANCLKATLGISDDEAIEKVHRKTFDERMIHLRQLQSTMNEDASIAFAAFDAAFEHLQVLRNLVAHCILIDGADDGTLFHLRSKDRTLTKSDVLASEDFTNYCAMVAMSLRYALGIGGGRNSRRKLPSRVKMPYGLQHYAMSVTIKGPSDCSNREIDQFRDFVRKGGEVTSAGLNDRIKAAEALAFLFVRKELAAIAALKNPSENHKQGVFENAGSVDAAFYRFELGWVYVAERFRENGYSKQILKELSRSIRSGGVYATSRIDNVPMHKSLESEGFIKIGDSWPSKEQPGKLLCLFVKD
jgi:hypothetical protein